MTQKQLNNSNKASYYLKKRSHPLQKVDISVKKQKSLRGLKNFAKITFFAREYLTILFDWGKII